MVLVAAVTAVLPGRKRLRGRPGSSGLVALILGVAALQLFGPTTPDLGRYGIDARAPGLVLAARMEAAAADPPELADRLLAAAGAASGAERAAHSTVVIIPNDIREHPIGAAQ